MLSVFVEIITEPAIVLGLVALIGLVLQRKRFPDVVKGTFKTILGLLILSAGSALIVDNLAPFADMFTEGFNLTGVVPFDEAVIGALIENVSIIARTTSFILALGFAVNVLLARITPFKYIFLTGHMMWILAGALAWAFHDLGVGETNTIIFGSILQGAILVLLPAIAQPIMRKVTGDNKIAYGHLTTIGVVASAYVGKLFGDPEKSSEDIKVPEGLNFFKDTAISVSFVMVLVYLITALFAGPEFVGEFAGEQHYLVFSLLKGLGFAAGVLVLLQGVRMFLGEIVPAFRGIALKVVPGAKPALDVPVLFPYAPNALMLGFIFAVAGTVVGMFASRLIGTVVPVPSIIGAFFTGGVAGIFGNALGGRRGAMISGFVYGLFLSIPVALFFPLYDLAGYGIQGVAFLVSDGIVALSLIKAFFAANIPYIGLGLFVVAMALLSWRFKSKKTHTENPSA
ncbi:MAG: PTS ascorbate transporter subunit IIC [Firmicutes bacterium]|nr:PTS ascorbate transporter subunit IIC [Bacillota bacterium]